MNLKLGTGLLFFFMTPIAHADEIPSTSSAPGVETKAEAARVAETEAIHWEPIGKKDGVVLSKRSVPGSALIAFRGEGELSAPIEKVVTILTDTSRVAEWADSVVEARRLREPSRHAYIEYVHVRVPFPLTDRDFVTRTDVTRDPTTQTWNVTTRSIFTPDAPKTSFVRGNLDRSVFSLRASKDGASTHVIAEVHCDPQGAIPKWLVNLFQDDWPVHTIVNIRKQAQRQDIATSAFVRTFTTLRLQAPADEVPTQENGRPGSDRQAKKP